MASNLASYSASLRKATQETSQHTICLKQHCAGIVYACLLVGMCINKQTTITYHLKKYHDTMYIMICYIINIRDFDKIFG